MNKSLLSFFILVFLVCFLFIFGCTSSGFDKNQADTLYKNYQNSLNSYEIKSGELDATIKNKDWPKAYMKLEELNQTLAEEKNSLNLFCNYMEKSKAEFELESDKAELAKILSDCEFSLADLTTCLPAVHGVQYKNIYAGQRGFSNESCEILDKSFKKMSATCGPLYAKYNASFPSMAIDCKSFFNS